MIKTTALVLRTCSEDMTSKNEFKWPQVGEVATAPDWNPNNECGFGLHGWLYGQGNHSCSSFLNSTAKWLVVEVEESGIIMLGGKCKFESGTVRFVGDMLGATQYLAANEPRSASVAIIGATLTVGQNQSATVGALGTATAGDRGTATAGDSGTATAGYSGTATAGAKGEIRIKYYDYKNERYRTKSGYVGEDGIEANVPYRLNENFGFVRYEVQS